MATTTAMLNEATPLVRATAQFVRQQLEANDASHDWRHIERVWTLARTLANEENVLLESREIVDLAALLHDIDDWKYQTKEGGQSKRAETFLRSQEVAEKTRADVMDIIAHMGFKDELGSAGGPVSVEFGCVQDADRLDAIGAIGIARCFTFGGAKNRILYDPNVPPAATLSKDIYMDKTRVSTTINHFYEKLLTLRDRMKTTAGKRLAEQRHVFMEQFLEQFHHEIAGEA